MSSQDLATRATELLPELAAACRMTHTESANLENGMRSFSEYGTSYSQASRDTKSFIKDQARSLWRSELGSMPASLQSVGRYEESKVANWAREGAQRARNLSDQFSKVFSRLDLNDPQHAELKGKMSDLLSDACSEFFPEDENDEVSSAGQSLSERWSSAAGGSNFSSSRGGHRPSSASRQTPTSPPISADECADSDATRMTWVDSSMPASSMIPVSA